jgi:molecular chaperone HtpG
MTEYRKSFLIKIHPYYDDTSLLFHETTLLIDPYYDEGVKLELYSVSNKTFENNVKLDWPNPLPRYDFGFNILGSGSVHGTLCLICKFKANIVLWNPSTKEFKLLPPSPFDSVPDTKIYHFHIEFGYDHIKCDYKVIRHIGIYDLPIMSKEDKSTIWEIYSLRSNS